MRNNNFYHSRNKSQLIAGSTENTDINHTNNQLSARTIVHDSGGIGGTDKIATEENNNKDDTSFLP